MFSLILVVMFFVLFFIFDFTLSVVNSRIWVAAQMRLAHRLRNKVEMSFFDVDNPSNKKREEI